MPFLRAFTDHMVQFINHLQPHGWDTKGKLPHVLKEQIKEVKFLLDNYNGKPFSEPPSKHLHSDSSNYAWAVVDPHNHLIVQDYWSDQKGLHINVKELQAAIFTVRALSKAKETVDLLVDNL